MSSSVVVAVFTVVAFVLVFNAAEADAKRGCTNFGHSCYGGMGKRGAPDRLETTGEEVMQMQEEENPAFVFTGPRSVYKPNPSQRQTERQYDNISKIVRQWVQNYRRAQEMQRDLI